MHLNNNNNNSLSLFSALSTGTGIKSAFGLEIIISVLNLHQAGRQSVRQAKTDGEEALQCPPGAF